MSKIYTVIIDDKAVRKLESYKKIFRFFYHPIRMAWFATELSLSLARHKGIKIKVIEEIDTEQLNIKIISAFPGSLITSPQKDACFEIYAYALANERDGIIPNPIYLGRDIDIGEHPGAFFLDRAGGKRRYTWRFPSPNEKVSELTVSDHLPKLLKTIKDPDTKFVISLSGGGLKVFAHCVIFRLMDALGVRSSIDEIWGTSAGAIAGLWYSSNVRVDEIEKSGYDLYNKRYSLKLSPSKLRVLKNLIREHLLPEIFRGSGFAGFLDSAKSIYDFICHVKKDRQPEIPLYCIAFNLNDFRTEVLTPLCYDIPEYKDFIFTVDPIEAAVASSSVPVLFVPKVIKRDNKEVTYIDGMTTESVPMYSIYKKWLTDKILGIEKREKLFILAAKVTKQTMLQQVPKHVNELKLVLLYHEAMRNAVAEGQRAYIERDPKVEIIEVSAQLSEWSNFDSYRIPDFIKASHTGYISDLLKFEKKMTRSNSI